MTTLSLSDFNTRLELLDGRMDLAREFVKLRTNLFEGCGKTYATGSIWRN